MEVPVIHPLILVGMGLLLVLSYLVLVLYPKKNRLRRLVILSIFWLFIIGAGGAYFINTRVKTYVDSFIRPVGAHQVLGQGELLLPPKTALSFRTGEESAQYFSRLSPAEVEEFYLNLAGAQVQSVPGVSGAVSLDIMYKDIPYTILVSPLGKHGSSLSITPAP